jgi:TPP-dependent pyruvate/acetoin dehydrogenase alpha subunit
MLMEAINLASVWALPVIFVCKDNDWAITTPSHDTYRGNLVERARSFGLAAFEVDGSDVEAVWDAAGEAISEARNRNGATFLHAHCVHLEGHFLGDPYYRVARHPARELWRMSKPLIRSFLHPGGARVRERIDAVRSILLTIWTAVRDYSSLEKGDPLARTRLKLQSDPERLESIEKDIRQEIWKAIELAQTQG